MSTWRLSLIMAIRVAIFYILVVTQITPLMVRAQVRQIEEDRRIVVTESITLRLQTQMDQQGERLRSAENEIARMQGIGIGLTLLTLVSIILQGTERLKKVKLPEV